MKKQAKYLTAVMSAVFAAFLLAQCASDRTENNQTADEHENVKGEYADAKDQTEHALASDYKAGADQYDQRWDDDYESDDNKQTKNKQGHDQKLDAEFAEINQEFKEAFEALGRNIEEDIDHTQINMAVNRLERISKRLKNRTDKLEEQLAEENKGWEAADELAELRTVQTELDKQIGKVKSASHENWDEVRKDTRKTCKEANRKISDRVGEIQVILADSK